MPAVSHASPRVVDNEANAAAKPEPDEPAPAIAWLTIRAPSAAGACPTTFAAISLARTAAVEVIPLSASRDLSLSTARPTRMRAASS
jgi:hypothetical protein